MRLKYFGELHLLTFNHKTALWGNTWEAILQEQNFFFQSMHTKNCFENNSQLNHNSHQLIPDRKLNVIGYQQLQSSNRPAGGAVAH